MTVRRTFMRENSKENVTTPRVLARLTAEDLSLVNGGIRPICPHHVTADLDGYPDTGGYSIDLGTNTCD
jgi:hypothetical protein